MDSSAGAYGAQPGYSQPGYSQPGYTPGYNAAPSYGPAGGNPYMSPAVNPYSEAAGPVYGGYALPAAAQGSADGMGISSMILGIVGLVLTLVSFCLSCAYIGVIGYPISLIVSIVGVILGHMARPSGMRVAGLVMNYINLAIYAAMILIVVIMLIFFGGIAALTPR